MGAPRGEGVRDMDVYETGGNFEDHGAEIAALHASRLRLAKFIRAGDATTLADEDAIRDEADRIVREEVPQR